MKHKRQSGFTVVEILVILAVIAILAVISIFQFGNWRLRTAQTEMKNELMSVSSSLKNHLNWNDVYPATLAGIDYAQNTNVTVTYVLRSGGASYCLQAASTAVTTAPMWYIDSNVGPTPTTTACS